MWLRVFIPPELCPTQHYPIVFSFVLTRRPNTPLLGCIKLHAYYCDVIAAYYICASDAEHRGRSPGCGWAGADVQTLLQLVPRPVLSPGQTLPPRLRQTSSHGSRYDDSPSVESNFIFSNTSRTVIGAIKSTRKTKAWLNTHCSLLSSWLPSMQPASQWKTSSSTDICVHGLVSQISHGALIFTFQLNYTKIAFYRFFYLFMDIQYRVLKVSHHQITILCYVVV